MTYVEERMRVTGRTCGSCTMCCLLLQVPETGKPLDGWCPHCKVGKGCSIYETRPRVCAEYGCNWLMEPTMPDWFKPSVSKIIVDLLQTEGEPWAEMRVMVHPKYPDRWREEPYYSWVKTYAAQGLKGEPVYFRTIVSVGSRKKWVILPNRDIPYGRGSSR